MKKYLDFPKTDKDTYVVGLAGHIDLLGEAQLEGVVKTLLTKIQGFGHKELVLLCPGAKGADQLVAKVARQLVTPISIWGIQILNYECNDSVLDVFKNNQEWLTLNKGTSEFENINLNNGYYETKIVEVMAIESEKLRAREMKDLIEDIHVDVSGLIAKNSDYLIVLWDGVDNGKRGGTSETVHIALHNHDFKGVPVKFTHRKLKTFKSFDEEKIKKTFDNPKGIIYQIVTPRISNPFPIGRFPGTLLANVPFVAPFEIGVAAFPQNPKRPKFVMRLRSRRKRSWFKTRNLINFWIPLLLAIITVSCGSSGFKDLRYFETAINDGTTAILQGEQYDFHFNSWPSLNDIFKAINLITFDSSSDINPQFFIPKLEVARWTGLLLVINAFIIGWLLAIAKNTKVILTVRWWAFRKKEFYIIAGLNDKSHHLALDLQNKGKRVVIIESEPLHSKSSELEKTGVSVFDGNCYSINILKKLRAERAKAIYLLNDDDTLSIRMIHELEQMIPHVKPQLKLDFKKRQNRYIHLSDHRYKDFVSRNHPDNYKIATHVFNIYENTARRLMMTYPVYRFDANKPDQNAEIFVFGFTEMAQQIVLNCLRNGFFDGRRRIKITVYTSEHIDKQTEFFKKYPALWHNSELNGAYEKEFAKSIRSEIFPPDMLTFKELALSDGAFFSDNTIADAILGDNIVSMYFCTPLSVQSAAYLNAVLPKIKNLQADPMEGIVKYDVKCFCHYNLFDKDEVTFVEHILNHQIPSSPVIFFGSFVNECTEEALSDRSDDQLPKLINLWYEHDNIHSADFSQRSAEQLFDHRSAFWIKRDDRKKVICQDLFEEANYYWNTTTVSDKESNRYAADHIWTKLHTMGLSFYKLNAKIKEQGIASVAAEFIYENKPDNEKLMQLVIMEHKRWCAGRLLEGYLPIQDFIEETNITDLIYRWNHKESNFKAYHKDQRQHIDLVPFDTLFESTLGAEHLNEKIKDVSMIEEIPYVISSAYKIHED